MSDYWIDNNIEKPQSIIVCAACKVIIKDKEHLILGARHYDNLMRATIDSLDTDTLQPIIRKEQGFIDQFGDFYNRKEALEIVKKNGQPFNQERNVSETKLFSEGLY